MKNRCPHCPILHQWTIAKPICFGRILGVLYGSWFSRWLTNAQIIYSVWLSLKILVAQAAATHTSTIFDIIRTIFLLLVCNPPSPGCVREKVLEKFWEMQRVTFKYSNPALSILRLVTVFSRDGVIVLYFPHPVHHIIHFYNFWCRKRKSLIDFFWDASKANIT